MKSFNYYAWLACLPVISVAQQAGNYTAEIHPSLTISKCSKGSGCTLESKSIVLGFFLLLFFIFINNLLINDISLIIY